MIIAIILAAGESRRMVFPEEQKIPKQLLPFGNSTVLETVIQNYSLPGINKIITVVSTQMEEVNRKIKGYPIEIVVNPDYPRGMLSSIQCGVTQALKIFREIAPSTSNGFLICLGDQPFIQKNIIHPLLQSFREKGIGIYIPVYQGRRGHPILIHQSFGERILQLDLAQGLRQLMLAEKESIHEIPVDSPWVLQDMDTPEEYQSALKEWEKEHRD